MLVATESWRPNLPIARRNLARLGGRVVAVGERDALPFRTASFDLVVSRHPVVTPWDEIARVLAHDGRYFSQQVGGGSNRELTEFLMGPQPVDAVRAPESLMAAAQAAGLTVVDLRDEWLRVEFYDIAAVVHFLRKVIWTVPDFTVERYRDELATMHERIRTEGAFVAHSRRILIEAGKSGPRRGS